MNKKRETYTEKLRELQKDYIIGRQHDRCPVTGIKYRGFRPVMDVSRLKEYRQKKNELKLAKAKESGFTNEKVLKKWA